MMADLIRFNESSGLSGYGFDLGADRVVRLNKHADGTYLNTRATYFINRKTYTHFRVRSIALVHANSSPAENKPRNWTWIIISCLVVAIALAKCELTVSINDTSPSSNTNDT